MPRHPAPQRASGYDKKVALVLQGGGALGSYQAGVYEALAGSEYLPDWVAGISIGAINAAIIAGNAEADRVAKLRRFPKKLAKPVLRVEQDTLVGTLDYGSVRIVTGTMGYKHRPVPEDALRMSMAARASASWCGIA